MIYELDGKKINVIIVKKNNKNTYIRIKEGKIYVTTNYFGSKSYVKNLLDKNKPYLIKMLNHSIKKEEFNSKFHYLGDEYTIISANFFDIDDINKRIFVPDNTYLDKWLKNKVKEIYQERLDYIYHLFEENIPYPNLKIRKMTTRWGVCNRKNNNVTLNSELIKYGYKQIDYVIVHELSHFVHFNHSKDFWMLVSKYCKDYKIIRKSLK